ncbi:hypothetical protein AHF37_10484 [Paragonimus kellicotti]|nr:hypothetical protein AHF37_10484 [Paragonimus kellicotti]
MRFVEEDGKNANVTFQLNNFGHVDIALTVAYPVVSLNSKTSYSTHPHHGESRKSDQAVEAPGDRYLNWTPNIEMRFVEEDGKNANVTFQLKLVGNLISNFSW